MDQVEREVTVDAARDDVWDAVTGPGWLAEEVDIDLTPGGDARFSDGAQTREGWVEDVRAPERLVFWWAAGAEPASRVELRLEDADGGTRVRVIETRPLEVLDLVGLPLRGTGTSETYGPALVAA